MHGVSIVGIDGTVVSFNLPNKLSKVISEHNLEKSTLQNTAFAAGFLELNLRFSRCKDAPFWASYWAKIK